MEQLFKCKTVKQRKIIEWLVAQSITGKDVAAAELLGPALVRVTNPAGQYMDVYCSNANDVRVLDVSAEREKELEYYFWEETNDPDTQEWREDLTRDEAAMVEQWDEKVSAGFSSLAQAIQDLEKKQESAANKSTRQDIPQRNWEPEL